MAAVKTEDQQEHPGTGRSKDTIFFMLKKTASNCFQKTGGRENKMTSQKFSHT